MYGGTCRGCGATTSGASGPKKAAKYCPACAGYRRKEWTKETVIVAIEKWADRHGRQPSATEWIRSGGDVFPSATTVMTIFDTWNAAIIAAGFRPQRGGRPVSQTNGFRSAKKEKRTDPLPKRVESRVPNTPAANRALVNAMRY